MQTLTLILRSLLLVGLTIASVTNIRADGWLFMQNSPSTLVMERDSFTQDLTPVPVLVAKVEFLYAPQGTTDFSLFQTVAGLSPLDINPVPGRFFSSSTIRLLDIEPAATIAGIVRGWTGSFATWEEAVASGTAKVGVSEIFLVATTDPELIPPPLPASILTSVPEQGFSGLILAVPEPSSLALAGLGAAALVLFRRRK